jgi:hypothetical protein
MAQNHPQAVPIYTSVPMVMAENNPGQSTWTFLFNYIQPSVSTMLSLISSAYIIIGIVLTGLEAGIINEAIHE